MSMSCRNCGFIDAHPPEPQLQNTKSSDSLVSQIIRGSRPLLDSDHAMLNANIVELEELQSLYAAQLQEIQLRRRAVLKALENRKSIYAPIRRLPRDILIEIFHSVCDSWWQEADDDWYWINGNRRHSLDVSGPLWVLGRVCGLWRDTLHSSLASWARKLVVRQPFSKYALAILQTYLEHTGEHLLNLEVSCRKPERDDEILSLLVQSCQWWKNLRIIATKQHMRHFKSMSQFPALQTIDIEIYDGYDYHSDMCLGAPQLWQASLRGHGIHQIKLPPRIAHFSGYITCLEDFRLLAELLDLRSCYLVMRLATKEALVVTMAQLTHLYVDDVNVLNVLSAPLLNSLTIDPVRQAFYSSTEQESLARFFHRSSCRLESLSVGKAIFTSSTPSSVIASEACSTVFRLKLELPLLISSVVEAFTFPLSYRTYTISSCRISELSLGMALRCGSRSGIHYVKNIGTCWAGFEVRATASLPSALRLATCQAKRPRNWQKFIPPVFILNWPLVRPVLGRLTTRKRRDRHSLGPS
ncbi:hypothetical protein ARMSODRAFT_1003307 [Armillaria solidipes]|uniref:F-box domain-containing protein n=1 Tax=Armillaria solidipes TaxID=1076256 RepID=A0A2H3BP61_9AGAR|nr:hypothetical protein ARMSODRAFT_1003307 [Armillaria solidipes]